MSQLEALLNRRQIRVRELEAIYAQGAADPGFVDQAITAARHLDPAPAGHAVWLLSRAGRAGRVNAAHLRRLAASADELTSWVSRLCLSQLLAVTGCPPDLRRSFHPFLTDCTTDRRPIVRAWALSALATYADDPEYAAEISTLLRQAAKDPAPSMRARLKHLKREARSARDFRFQTKATSSGRFE